MHFSPVRKFIIVFAAAFVVAGSFGAGFYAGSERKLEIQKVTGLYDKEQGKPATVDFAAFWKAWNVLNDKFVDTHKNATTTDQEKVYGAIAGLASSLKDPYTVFFPPVEKQVFETAVAGNFEGIGLEIGIKNEVLTAVSPIKGSPADLAGIKPGDKILKINASSTEGLSVDQAVNIIRGKKGTPVTLHLSRAGVKDAFDVTMTRDVINLPTIDTKARPDGVFVIQLYSFTETSPALFQKALQEFAASGDTKLVLDLRGNPGGYLEAAVSMASWFLPEGKVVVREDYGGGQPEEVLRSAGYNVFNGNLKMVILVDGGSASASEILSGALREQGVAKLVGEKTFGKGSVQEVVPITEETSLKVTIARWLTPNGISISQNGLDPDVVVKSEKGDVAGTEHDAQLKKAVEILLAK